MDVSPFGEAYYIWIGEREDLYMAKNPADGEYASIIPIDGVTDLSCASDGVYTQKGSEVSFAAYGLTEGEADAKAVKVADGTLLCAVGKHAFILQGKKLMAVDGDGKLTEIYDGTPSGLHGVPGGLQESSGYFRKNGYFYFLIPASETDASGDRSGTHCAYVVDNDLNVTMLGMANAMYY